MSGRAIAVASNCANCHQPLSGRYCSACGQRYEPHVHSLREFLSEAAEVITHADSRLWRTLSPLLFRPGFLTQEFFRGRRARYLPPFRLYIVASLIFFLVASAGFHKAAFLQIGTKDGLPVSLQKLDVDENTQDFRNETREHRAERICGGIHSDLSTALEPRLRAACHEIVMDGGRAAVQELFHNIPRALIVLLPLLALVMRLIYLRRYYVEHLLFFVHNHAFTFLFLTIYTLAIRLSGAGWLSEEVSDTLIGILTTLMTLIVPYYAYRAMLRVYGQGKWVTRLKFTVLAFAYFVLILFMGIAMSLYTVITL